MNILAFQFGINEALSVIIFILSIGMVISELKVNKKVDIVTNIIISLLLYGVSIYNLVTLGFSEDSILISVVYCVTLVSSTVFTGLYIYHHIKYSKPIEEKPEEEKNEEPKEENIEE